ncbi:hypothetical protein BC828DRAFT_405687 [Blastocladiella britannica]|nr:hypothetical protein BC828DRAFT_405687 [Blastocladiella britannica]
MSFNSQNSQRTNRQLDEGSMDIDFAQYEDPEDMGYEEGAYESYGGSYEQPEEFEDSGDDAAYGSISQPGGGTGMTDAAVAANATSSSAAAMGAGPSSHRRERRNRRDGGDLLAGGLDAMGKVLPLMDKKFFDAFGDVFDEELLGPQSLLAASMTASAGTAQSSYQHPATPTRD